MTFAQYELST